MLKKLLDMLVSAAMKGERKVKNLYRVVLILSVVCIAACVLYAQEQQPLAPKKVEVDRNYDTVPDRFEYYDKDGKITRVETDTDFNGKIDEWVYYKNGVVEKAEKDTNGDGKPDTWLAY